jgi:hypothetical protein
MEGSASANKRRASTLFWRVFALINLVTVAWIGWVFWQVTPHSLVNELVSAGPAPHRAAAGTIAAAPGDATAGSAPAPAALPAAAIPEIPIHSGPPMASLKLDPELRTLPKSDEPATAATAGDGRRRGGAVR